MFLTFGETMIRVAPEGFARFTQALPGKMEVTFGGAEANVAASLAILGDSVRHLTALPQHAIADALVATLRGLGIDTRHILRTPRGRLGIYFLETGANQRASNVIYDRANTAIAQADPEAYDLDAALTDVHWVHLTGITPSLSKNAFRATLRLAQAAKARGASVSCDLNFRKKLWLWRPGADAQTLARECMAGILPLVDVVIGNEEDADHVLGIRAEGTSVEAGRIDAQAYQDVARRIVQRFPNVRTVATTLRESVSASHNNWGGMLYDPATDRAHFAPLDAEGRYRPYEIRNIVDRVGGGDAFAAGLLHALNGDEHAAPEMAVRYAVAASCLKHSIPGDLNYATAAEVAALVQGQASGRVQR